MSKVTCGSSLTRLLLTTTLSLPLMSASTVGVRAETVIGAGGAPGADCPLTEYFCTGGNGGEGESVTAYGNPAVAYGGNGGAGGMGAAGGESSAENMGFGGDGGSAMAVAEASAASGDVMASALAVGGMDGGYYYGDTRSGDASASATAISGDVSVSSAAVASGSLNPGEIPLPGANASALSVALPDKANAAALIGSANNVADALLGAGRQVFGIASLSEHGSGDYSNTFGSYSSSSTTFSFPYHGDLLLGFIEGFGTYPEPYEEPFIYISVNGYPVGYSDDNSVMDLGSNFGPNIDLTMLAFDAGVGVDLEIAVGGAVPQAPTWAMMLIGFAGLGFAGHRTSRGAGRMV